MYNINILNIFVGVIELLVLAYDHGAWDMFQNIKVYLDKKKIEYIDCSSKEYDALDSFADFAIKANSYVKKGYIIWQDSELTE